MISRRDAAIQLDIPLEMAAKHGIPKQVAPDVLAALEAEPPAWLVQSRLNRTGKPVWAELRCVVCRFAEVERPKKWWPSWTFLACDDHDADELPVVPDGAHRDATYGVGSRFVAYVDSVPA
ncbi:hypothetical protein CLV49_3496 [Labedella gwakjiensis]|uniref:Uncharacterized protein n=1 Tax=Labedella gwakjiensis TaxID=390269 RepID=A0A2P8H0V3_9MICO|nr:hypothetical protein [Labedella gwakjiensis]PSL39845.1 hypothetical protein CLV49_3496 [Labedella gwakjiensis]RUQ85782.1 hypothetical protein ELQ93_01775 [Labedella gwakjiensis]